MFQVALVMLASKYVDLIVPGYTHLQRAQPVLLPHHLLSYVEQVIDLAFLDIMQHW
jgi:argininosuccinate lyase